MAAAVADVGPAFLDALAPAVEIEPAVFELDVDSPQADALAVNTGKIGLAADPRAKAAIQGVIPDVQLPRSRRVHRRQEIDCVVHHVHDVFIGADAVEGRNLVGRNRVGRGLQSPARVGEPDDPSLRFAPLQYGKVPARPLIDPRGARIVVLLEAQQAEMPRVRRRESPRLRHRSASGIRMWRAG